MVGGARVTVGSHDSWDDAAGAIAEFWRLRAATEVAAGAGIMSLRAWGVQYLDARETDGVHRDSDSDRNRWNARIASKPLAEMSLDTIDSRDVRAWLADQIKAPSARGKRPAKTTVSNALNLLRVALEAAVEAGHIPSNPARNVRMPRMAQSDEVWDWLRAREIEKLLAVTSGDQRAAFTVALYTGLRKGELWGLRWQDIDFAGAQLTVRKSYDGPTKGGRQRRVPLLKPALDALREQHRRPRLCSLVFPAHGPVMRTEYDSLGLDEALELAKVRRIRFHDLRHTCASHLVQGTWAPAWIAAPLRLEEVKEWLGHKSITTTQRYAHFCADSIHGKVTREPRKPELVPPSKPVDAQWSEVDANASEKARLFLVKTGVVTEETAEARIGFEPTLDGFANRASPRGVTGTWAVSRPLRDRISEMLQTYARGETPVDVQLVEVLAAAFEALELGGAVVEAVPATGRKGVV